MGHPYEQVSFIKLGKQKVGGYWVVEPPADYTEGWSFGEDRALELLQWVKRGAIPDLGFVLNQIAEAQHKDRVRDGTPKAMGRRGAINGFWRAVGWFAADSAAGADFDGIAKRLMDQRAKAAATLAANLKEQKQEASDRARHAANARWGKKAA